jgi:hypothetical protein
MGKIFWFLVFNAIPNFKIAFKSPRRKPFGLVRGERQEIKKIAGDIEIWTIISYHFGIYLSKSILVGRVKISNFAAFD